MMDAQRFDDIAAGARELRATVERGDIALRVARGAAWSLEYTSTKDAQPEVERDGDTLRVKQQGHGRLDVRITAPDLERVELRTGGGRVEATGTRGRSRLVSGHGAVTLRDASGEAELDTGNGAVDVEGFDGALGAASGNGRVRVARLEGRARLKTGNGAVEVLDAEGRVQASTGNGDMALARVGGEAELKTGHGAITIGEPRELAVRATTALGAITVTDGSARDLRLKSMLGEVRCSAALAPGRHELETAMGGVTLELPDDVSARVDAQTAFGTVRSDFPLVRVGRSGPMGFGGVRMVGGIGGGAPLVELALRSSKGDITLGRRPEAPAWPSGTATPREASAVATDVGAQSPTLAVLEALARGEVTPAEAEDLLSRRAP